LQNCHPIITWLFATYVWKHLYIYPCCVQPATRAPHAAQLMVLCGTDEGFFVVCVCNTNILITTLPYFESWIWRFWHSVPQCHSITPGLRTGRFTCVDWGTKPIFSFLISAPFCSICCKKFQLMVPLAL